MLETNFCGGLFQISLKQLTVPILIVIMMKIDVDFVKKKLKRKKKKNQLIHIIVL